MGRVGRFGGVAIIGGGVGIRCRWGSLADRIVLLRLAVLATCDPPGNSQSSMIA